MNGCLKLYRLIHGVQEFEICSIFNLMTLAATSLLQLSGRAFELVIRRS